eukprot:Gb_32584 [translate_table: standard]
MESTAGSLPERPDEPDCGYYMRTGLCGFGPTCRFNHPPDRRMAINQVEYPERIGQPECQTQGSNTRPELIRLPHSSVAGRIYTSHVPKSMDSVSQRILQRLKWCNPLKLMNSTARVSPLTPQALALCPEMKCHIRSFSKLILLQEFPRVGKVFLFLHAIVFICNATRFLYIVVLYYLKTATCKFGLTCKYHHPRDKAGIARAVPLNVLGYPLRVNEKECAFYLRNGQCKYGIACKFHHPEPVDTLVSVPMSPLYLLAPSPAATAHQQYPGVLPTWTIVRTSPMLSPHFHSPSTSITLIHPKGIISVSGWHSYTGQVGPIASPDNQKQVTGTGLFYGPTYQTDPCGIQGGVNLYPSEFSAMGFPVLQVPSSGPQIENMFPERPGQPECQFYMKTGDCKFGMKCRYHHPKDVLLPTANSMLNTIGLPLHPTHSSWYLLSIDMML